MADREAIALLQELAILLREERLPVEGLVLFGSMARGDAHEWSDIDVIALASDTVPREELFGLAGTIQEVANRLDNRFEIIAVRKNFYETDEGSPIIEIARTEGIRVAA